MTALAAATLLAVGCMHRQVARDGIGSRQAILDVYTDQIMDNLIRARRGLPFVQLSYRNILVQELDSFGGGATDTAVSSTDQSVNAVGAVSGVVRKWGNTVVPTFSGKRDRTISFSADPVTDKNDIYEYYLAFASDPTLLVESDSKPTCAVHMCRQWGDRWYYVPCEAAGVFLQLSLKTTFMRGAEKAPGPEYFEANIANYVPNKKATMGVEIHGFVVLDRSIKNDNGYMIVTLDDKRKFRLPIFRVVKEFEDEPGVKFEVNARGAEVNVFRVEWSLNEQKVQPENLVNGKAKFYLQNYFPPAPPPPADLQRLNDNLDQIRLNQLNQSNK